MLDVLMGPFHTSAVVAALVALVALHHAREQFDRVRLGGADIFGRFIDRGMVPAVARLVYLVGAFAAAALVLREEIRHLRTRVPGEWLTAVLAASSGLCLAGNLLCSADINARQRFPLLIIAGIVLARRLGTPPFPWIERRKLLAGAVGAALLLAFSGPFSIPRCRGTATRG